MWELPGVLLLRNQQGYRGIRGHSGLLGDVGLFGGIRGVGVSGVYWVLAGTLGNQGPAGV